MSTKSTKEKAKEGTKTERAQGFADMCRRMMSGGMPDCCGPEMREMISSCLAGGPPPRRPPDEDVHQARR
jgi:hypothetical protein